MGCTIIEGLVEWINFNEHWSQWASQNPPLWRPIKYIKWRLSEPKYEDFYKGDKL